MSTPRSPSSDSLESDSRSSTSTENPSIGDTVPWYLRLHIEEGSTGQDLQQEDSLAALFQTFVPAEAALPAGPEEEEHLALRLEAVLAGGAQAIGCQAAAMYLLDESTRHLKLQACWGLPKRRLLDPPRPLRGAVAELEALVGHAVVLENTQQFVQLRPPEDFPAAVCVPISSPTLPLGVLWMFSDQPRGFSSEETNLTEIIAGRLAADLDRQALLHERTDARRSSRQLTQAAAWQDSRMPRIAPLLDDWEMYGCAMQADQVGGAVYDWGVLPDGRLALATGGTVGDAMEAALTAAVLHGALRAHAGYRHSAKSMLERLNDTMFASSTGGQCASLIYVLIDPGTGESEAAWAGRIGGVLLGQGEAKILGGKSPLLGETAQTKFCRKRFQIGDGDAILLVNSDRAARFSDENLLAELRTHRPASARRLVDEVLNTLHNESRTAHDIRTADRALLAAKRMSPSMRTNLDG